MVRKLCYNENMHRRYNRQGFTLVELSLSIAFVGVLSLSVALIITNSISAYHRGVILDQVNSTGMEIVDDMRGAVQSSQARSTKSMCAMIYDTSTSGLSSCESDSGRGFVSLTRYATVEKSGTSIGTLPVVGAFCTGGYSYIWNSGYFFNQDSAVKNVARATFTYRNSSGATQTKSDFKLLKVRDVERSVCVSAVGNSYNKNNINTGSSDFNITGSNTSRWTKAEYDALDEEPYDILNNSNSLAIYELTSSMSGKSGVINSAFYSVSFILGTVQGGININSVGDHCNVPADYSAISGGFDYCAINKFNFAAQASGG